MSVDLETVQRIARLARIKVADDQSAAMVGELNAILDWCAQLDEVDTKDVPPMTSVVAQKLTRRKDDVTDGGYQDRVTKNAPQGEDGFFTVPKVVE